MASDPAFDIVAQLELEFDGFTRDLRKAESAVTQSTSKMGASIKGLSVTTKSLSGGLSAAGAAGTLMGSSLGGVASAAGAATSAISGLTAALGPVTLAIAAIAATIVFFKEDVVNLGLKVDGTAQALERAEKAAAKWEARMSEALSARTVGQDVDALRDKLAVLNDELSENQSILNAAARAELKGDAFAIEKANIQIEINAATKRNTDEKARQAALDAEAKAALVERLALENKRLDIATQIVRQGILERVALRASEDALEKSIRLQAGLATPADYARSARERALLQIQADLTGGRQAPAGDGAPGFSIGVRSATEFRGFKAGDNLQLGQQTEQKKTNSLLEENNRLTKEQTSRLEQKLDEAGKVS